MDVNLSFMQRSIFDFLNRNNFLLFFTPFCKISYFHNTKNYQNYDNYKST